MKILKPKYVKNKLFYILGAIFIVLNYIRHSLSGYRTPRTFPSDQFELAVDYDFKVVERWVNYLKNYSKEIEPLKEKVVLELGPGPDLGTGLILLAMGAEKYIAMDVNNLAESIALDFYKKLFERLEKKHSEFNINNLKVELNKCYKGENSNLNYIVDEDFNITRIKEGIDVVLSSVAFEHFEDVEKNIKEISAITKKGSILIAHIDLKTHSRWLKNIDPLNIYRYSTLFWNIFKFKGSPNRVRPSRYRQLLEVNDWDNIIIEPRTLLEKEYVNKVLLTLNKKFRNNDVSEMQICSIVLMAKKK